MPSKITVQATTPIGLENSVEAIKQGSMSFRFFGQNPDSLDNELNLSNTQGFRAGEATLTNATITSIAPSSQPTSNWGGETIFGEGDEAPLIFTPTNVLRITATSANGTATFDTNLTDYSNSNYLMVVYRHTSSALVAGDLKLVLRSSVGNYVTLTSQKSGSQNEWTYEIFKLQEDGTTGVAFTGTPVFTSMETDVVASVSGDTLEVAKIYTAQDVASFPNADRTIFFDNKCLDELTFDYGLSMQDKTCGLKLKKKFANGIAPMISVTIKNPDLLMQGASWGKVVKVDNQPTEETREYTVSAGVIALGSAIGGANTIQNVRQITINGNVLQSALNNDVESNQFYVDRTTGDITVSTDYNTLTAKVSLTVLREIHNYTMGDLDIGILGTTIVQFTQKGKTEYYYANAQLLPNAENKTKDNSFTYVYDLQFVENSNKEIFTKGLF